MTASHVLALVESSAFASAVERLRSLGVFKFTLGTFSVELEHNFAPAQKDFSAPAGEIYPRQPDPLQTPATADEILFWSAGGSGIEGAPPDFSDTDFEDEAP